MKTAIFAESSISPHFLTKLPNTIVLPAASRDSFAEVARSDVERIILIDGVFYTQRAVWHRDILYAIGKGIKVFGVSSMGALRAAELFSFGMKGYGWVYRQYIRGVIYGDDEVSLYYEKRGETIHPLTYPVVSLRYLLSFHFKLKGSEFEELISKVKNLSFDARTYDRIFYIALESLGPVFASRLKGLMLNSAYDVKNMDALRLVSRLYKDDLI